MRRFAMLLALLSAASLPICAQEYLSNGRHNGPYQNGGNPYAQKGGGIAPIFRTEDGRQPSTVMPQPPGKLPEVPTWQQVAPDNGHSLQFQQYQESQQTPPVPAPVIPVIPPPQQQTYNPQPAAPAQPELETTARKTLTEIEQILDFQPTRVGPVNYLSWYLNGAYIDPGQFLKTGAEWPEDAFQHFMADYLVAFWNVTMQDAALRILVPLILVAMLFKIGSMAIDRLLKAETA